MTSPVSSDSKSPINMSSAKQQEKHVLNLNQLANEAEVSKYSPGASALVDAVY